MTSEDNERCKPVMPPCPSNSNDDICTIQKKTTNLAQVIHQALDAFDMYGVLEWLFHFNSVNICSRVSSSDLRKSLAFAATLWVSVLCVWLKISDMLDEPPPFHARIYDTLVIYSSGRAP